MVRSGKQTLYTVYIIINSQLSKLMTLTNCLFDLLAIIIEILNLTPCMALTDTTISAST